MLEKPQLTVFSAWTGWCKVTQFIERGERDEQGETEHLGNNRVCLFRHEFLLFINRLTYHWVPPFTTKGNACEEKVVTATSEEAARWAAPGGVGGQSAMSQQWPGARCARTALSPHLQDDGQGTHLNSKKLCWELLTWVYYYYYLQRIWVAWGNRLLYFNSHGEVHVC